MRELKITTGVAAALLAAACGQQESADNGWTADRDTAVCVDKAGNRVPDGQCPDQHQAVAGSAAGGGHISPFLWYYLGRQSAVPYYGERVGGGSYVPAGGHSYFRAPAAMTGTRSAVGARGGSIVRGGFGASAHGGAGE